MHKNLTVNPKLLYNIHSKNWQLLRKSYSMTKARDIYIFQGGKLFKIFRTKGKLNKLKLGK